MPGPNNQGLVVPRGTSLADGPVGVVEDVREASWTIPNTNPEKNDGQDWDVEGFEIHVSSPQRGRWSPIKYAVRYQNGDPEQGWSGGCDAMHLLRSLVNVGLVSHEEAEAGGVNLRDVLKGQRVRFTQFRRNAKKDGYVLVVSELMPPLRENGGAPNGHAQRGNGGVQWTTRSPASQQRSPFKHPRTANNDQADQDDGESQATPRGRPTRAAPATTQQQRRGPSKQSRPPTGGVDHSEAIGVIVDAVRGSRKPLRNPNDVTNVLLRMEGEEEDEERKGVIGEAMDLWMDDAGREELFESHLDSVNNRIVVRGD